MTTPLSGSQIRPPRPWLPLAFAVLAVGLMAGGAFLLRPASPPATPPTAPAVNGPVHGLTPTVKFGLPAFPTAYRFHSLTVDTARGSSAYSVERGTAAEIVAFYRKELEADGWRFLRQLAHEEQPGNSAVTAPKAKGWRVVWERTDGTRRLTLVALDFPQKGRALWVLRQPRRDSTAQVLLQWSPLP